LGSQGATFWVMKSRNDAKGLVQHQIQPLGRPRDDSAVHTDHIFTPTD
jgi:hypothetical protein